MHDTTIVLIHWFARPHANLIHRVTNKNLTTLTETKIEETKSTLKW